MYMGYMVLPNDEKWHFYVDEFPSTAMLSVLFDYYTDEDALKYMRYFVMLVEPFITKNAKSVEVYKNRRVISLPAEFDIEGINDAK